MADDLQENLKGVSKELYGKDYADHLFAQYKLYVEMADKISERRQIANTFFLTINTAIVSMLGIAWPHAHGAMGVVWYVVVCSSGLILCYSWYRLLKSYRDLNSGKFLVVHAIEKHLPMRLYDAEWESLGRGKNSKIYLPFTHIETKVPWVFFAMYLFLIIVSIMCYSYMKYL